MKKFNPLVSIIIPVFNGANYLEGTIKSALGQTYQNIEVIVINDGSSDNGATEKIAKQFGDQIRYFHQANGGCAAALNCGIAHMKGEYFSWLSHDDLYVPEKISEQIELLKELVNKNSIIYSAYEYIDEKSNHIDFVFPHETLSSKDLTNPLMPLLRGLINGCALLIPKKLFVEIGTFDITKRTTQDYALWFDCLRKAPLEYISKPLIKCRIHSAQDTQRINDVHLRETNELWSGFLERLTLDEMKKLDGSQIGFLANMADHLAITPYNLAREKARQGVLQIIHQTPVSIVLLAEDSADLLTQSIHSIAQQTHQNLEVLVVHPQSLTLPNQTSSGLAIRSFSYADSFSINSTLTKAIAQSTGDLIAFLRAGDLFKEEKIFDHALWMLRHDAGISVTAFESENPVPIPSSDQDLPQFHQNGFPKLLLKFDQYFSTLMVKGSSARLLASDFKQGGEASEALPLWCNIFTLYSVSYLNKALTIERKQPIQNLSQLQRVMLQKMLRMTVINSEAFLLATNLSHRTQSQSGLATTDFIAHQLKAYEGYEYQLLSFWGPQKPDYKTVSIHEQLAIIQSHLALVRDTYRYRLHRKILWVRRARLADYEGALVRITKPLVPQFLWRYSTALYRKMKQLITPNN